jgi:hypothetical protein
MTRYVAFLLVLAALVSGRPAAAQAPVQDAVDVALVLLADGSGSIDPDEFQLQREGYADALTSREVLSAIRSNPHQKIGVIFVEWGAPSSQEIIINWTVIDGEASAAAFAAELRAKPKMTFGYNSISNALDFGVKLLGSAPFTMVRKVIDVSGDGPNIGGRDILAARDEAVGQGITINALAIRQPGSVVAPSLGVPLEDYYRDNVIGGLGAFVETADGRQRFAQAIRNKLVLEIASLDAGGSPQGG